MKKSGMYLDIVALGQYTNAQEGCGMLITLADYAQRNGHTAKAVRQMAERGRFQTAAKIGRDWLIEDSEVYPGDLRMKSQTPLALARREKGLTQKELAAECDCFISEISSWERWDGRPNARRQQLIADYLGKSAEELFPKPIKNPKE